MSLKPVTSGIYGSQKGLAFLSERSEGRVRAWAQELGPNEAVELRPKGSGGRYLLTSKAFYVVLGEAGKGASTTVYHAKRHQLDGGMVAKKVVKISEHGFEDQANYLNKLSPNSKGSKKIDHFDGLFRLGNQGMAVCDPSDRDLNHVDFTELEMPATTVVKWLGDYLEGLAAFHRENMVNRDVKGGNFLVSEKGAKITDFGLCLKVSDKEHYTATTLTHAASFIWPDFKAQLERRGKQTKAADIFAIGRLIQLDVLNRLIRQFSKKYKLGISTRGLTPRQLSEDSVEKVRDAHEKYGNQVITGPSSENGYASFVFRDPQVVFEKCVEAINQLTMIPSPEQKKLRALARLARELQQPTREGVCEELHAHRFEENAHDLLIQKVVYRLGLIQDGWADGRTARKKLSFGESQPSKGKRKREELAYDGDDISELPTQIVEESLSNKKPELEIRSV
jgi:serine/threonine protein kinase